MISPFAVICPAHGRMLLTDSEYEAQLFRPAERWHCPCGCAAVWDDDWYEEHLDAYLDASCDDRAVCRDTQPEPEDFASLAAKVFHQ